MLNRAAYTASLVDDELLDEDEQLRLAIEISQRAHVKVERNDEDSDSDIELISESKPKPLTVLGPATGSSSRKAAVKPEALSKQDQLRERAERMKRKAEEEVEQGPSKATKLYNESPRQDRLPVPSTSASNIRTLASASSSTSSSKAEMLFKDGAIRITRTPGRRNASNTVSLPDLIKQDHLVSACIFSFFIAQHELFSHLPLTKSSRSVPVRTPFQGQCNCVADIT